MRKIIEKIRLKIALWLLISPKVSATATTLMQRHEMIRCVHCGKNPFFKELK